MAVSRGHLHAEGQLQLVVEPSTALGLSQPCGPCNMLVTWRQVVRWRYSDNMEHPARPAACRCCSEVSKPPELLCLIQTECYLPSRHYSSLLPQPVLTSSVATCGRTGLPMAASYRRTATSPVGASLLPPSFPDKYSRPLIGLSLVAAPGARPSPLLARPAHGTRKRAYQVWTT